MHPAQGRILFHHTALVKSVPIYFRDSIFFSVVSLQAIFSLLSYQTVMWSPKKLSGLQQRWLWSWLYRSKNSITTKHVTGMKQTPAKSCDQPVFPPSVLFAWWEIIIRTTVRVITGKWKKEEEILAETRKRTSKLRFYLVFFLHARYLSKIWILIILYFRYDSSCFYQKHIWHYHDFFFHLIGEYTNRQILSRYYSKCF